MKSVAVSQSNYLPWVGYFKLISQADCFVFYDSVQYTKNDWRNRNRIIIDGAPNWLTIPIKYRFSERKRIDEIELPQNGWGKEHLNKIERAYKSTDYFLELFPFLEEEISKNYLTLSELNKNTIMTFSSVLNIETKFLDYSLNLELSKNQRLIDTCKSVGAQQYVTTPKALNYLDIQLFKDNDIELKILDFESCLKKYPQKSYNFDPYVSFIDLLFNLGINGVEERLTD